MLRAGPDWAQGLSVDEAYAEADYKANCGNAATLKAN